MIIKPDDFDPSDMMPATERVNTGLMNNHIHYLFGEITEYNIADAIKWILYENTIKEENKTLTLYINSFGGNLYEALALVGVMKNSLYPVRTVGLGSVISAGFLIFACGERGHRVISSNSAIMSHQFSGGFFGKEHDIKAMYKQNEITSNKLIEIFSEVSNLTKEEVKEKLMPPSDVWLTPEELQELGIADIIV